MSNTAFRGFGGPQGMMGIEKVIDAIARELGLDPLEVRRRNLYGPDGRDVTPYHMRVQDNILPELIDELEQTSAYGERREAIAAFNAKSPILKRGLALTPVKFGIAFTSTALNQGGALVHVYTDGSVQLNHGGTEMGQGLMIKVAQVVAEEFQIDLDRVKITADQHRQGAQHLGDRRLRRHRSERRRGAGGGAHPQGAPDRFRGGAFPGAARGSLIPA